MHVAYWHRYLFSVTLILHMMFRLQIKLSSTSTQCGTIDKESQNNDPSVLVLIFLLEFVLQFVTTSFEKVSVRRIPVHIYLVAWVAHIYKLKSSS